MTYAFTADYKADLHEHITNLFTLAKTLNTTRAERLQASDDLIEAYYEHTETTPDGNALERLATLILRDELTDTHPDKMTREEYPLLSDDQSQRRNESEFKISGVEYGKEATTGYRKVAFEDENGVTHVKRKRIYQFPK